MTAKTQKPKQAAHAGKPVIEKAVESGALKPEPEKKSERNFELERMIFFSDAVFAIAITLLILEVRLPKLPVQASSAELWHTLKPFAVKFFGFILSFFFIGIMWAKHLRMFKFLKAYNTAIIVLNLVFLFFIVCFPFSVSAFSANEGKAQNILIPLLFYLANISLVTIALAGISFYLFRLKPACLVEGFEPEKKYFLAESIVQSVVVTLVFCGMIFSYGLSMENSYRNAAMLWVMAVLLGLSRIYLKRYKRKLKTREAIP